MKILIVNNMAPFVWGGAEELATHLQKNIIVAGHEAEILRIPFQFEPASRILSQMLVVKGLELTNVDRVIALKFPAYLIRHPHKTIWLLHQYRQAYDLYGTCYTNLPANKQGEDIRQLITTADSEVFAESKRIFTNSEVTRQRLKHYNGFDSTVLLPPVNDPELFACKEIGNYLFAGGRVNNMKRQYLLLEALKLSKSNLKLVIAGPPDSSADMAKLNELVEKFSLKDRVILDLRFLPRETYTHYLNCSAGVAYLPYDEDSLGYVAMEAAIANKAILTTSDSGGILSLAKHQQTGWVGEADPLSLAEGIDFFSHKLRVKELGLAARALWDSLGINWMNTVETLLQ